MASELIPVPDDLGFEPTIRGLESTQRVFDRYVLRRILGRGGMGIVWLSHDERLERDVALKFLPDAINFDPAALDDLKRETRRCLELTHPNIIRIYDFVKDEQAAAISMEYIDGQTLAALRVEQPTRVFEVGELRNWMIKACQALHYAHEEVGVVHRDLKPANFMVTARGQMKVADFGIAQSVVDSMSRLTLRRSSSGTLAYMSPQQLNGEMAKPSDDIYALGATIYELLTGKPPFHSGDVPFQIRLSVPRPMAAKRQELEVSGDPIPAAWEDAIASCLAKIPEERPATMAELAERLRAASPTRRLPAVSAKPSPDVPRLAPALSTSPTTQATNAPFTPATSAAAPVPQPDDQRQSLRRAFSLGLGGIRNPILLAVAGGLALLAVMGVVLFFHHGRPATTTAARLALPVPDASAAATAATALDTVPPAVDAAPVVAAPVTAAPLPVATQPAELRVDSNPAGALVQIEGRQDQHTPAVFNALPAGTYRVTVSADGYQPLHQTVAAAPGAKLDLGTLMLARIAGNLNLNTVPPHAQYTLTGLDGVHDVQKTGTTPDYFPALPAGTYQVTLTKPGFPTYTGSILVQDHSTKVVTADLTELALAASASPNPAKVIRGQLDLAQLNPTERNELASLEGQAFATYLNGNLLSYASGELAKLKALGIDTSAQETQLATRQLTAETQIAAQLRTLIHARKWATASQLFSTLNDSFEKESMDRLNGEFEAPLAQYQQQIDTAIAQSKSAPPEVGYLQLKALVAQYPSELNLQLALASVAEHAAPDHARLTDLLQVFRAFAKSNKDIACQPVFVDTQAAVADELQQLEAVTAALTAAKEGTPEQKHQLASLEARKEAYENRRIGSPDKNNPFSAAVNFFGKAVTGHAVVNNRPYFETRQQKREAIEDVESEVTALKATMVQPPDVVDQAQKNYDAFTVRVPWGPTT